MPSVREAPRVSREAQLPRNLATLDSSPVAWTSVFRCIRYLQMPSDVWIAELHKMAGNRMLAPRAKSASPNLSRCSQTIKNRAAQRFEWFWLRGQSMTMCVKSIRLMLPFDRCLRLRLPRQRMDGNNQEASHQVEAGFRKTAIREVFGDDPPRFRMSKAEFVTLTCARGQNTATVTRIVTKIKIVQNEQKPTNCANTEIVTIFHLAKGFS
jgi:hypothetical protein